MNSTVIKTTIPVRLYLRCRHSILVWNRLQHRQDAGAKFQSGCTVASIGEIVAFLSGLLATLSVSTFDPMEGEFKQASKTRNGSLI